MNVWVMTKDYIDESNVREIIGVYLTENRATEIKRRLDQTKPSFCEYNIMEKPVE